MNNRDNKKLKITNQPANSATQLNNNNNERRRANQLLLKATKISLLQSLTDAKQKLENYDPDGDALFDFSTEIDKLESVNTKLVELQYSIKKLVPVQMSTPSIATLNTQPFYGNELRAENHLTSNANIHQQTYPSYTVPSFNANPYAQNYPMPVRMQQNPAPRQNFHGTVTTQSTQTYYSNYPTQNAFPNEREARQPLPQRIQYTHTTVPNVQPVPQRMQYRQTTVPNVQPVPQRIQYTQTTVPNVQPVPQRIQYTQTTVPNVQPLPQRAQYTQTTVSNVQPLASRQPNPIKQTVPGQRMSPTMFQPAPIKQSLPTTPLQNFSPTTIVSQPASSAAQSLPLFSQEAVALLRIKPNAKIEMIPSEKMLRKKLRFTNDSSSTEIEESSVESDAKEDCYGIPQVRSAENRMPTNQTDLNSDWDSFISNGTGILFDNLSENASPEEEQKTESHINPYYMPQQ